MRTTTAVGTRTATPRPGATSEALPGPPSGDPATSPSAQMKQIKCSAAKILTQNTLAALGSEELPDLLAIYATATTAPAPTAEDGTSQEREQVFEPADTLPSRSEAAAVQPVIGISQRVQMNSKEKKDLGTLGYVLGLIMMVIIIAIGAGIVVGYIYKRGKDLKEKHEQKVYEREMQRITLPLSAFSNPACELVDENTIVVHTNQTPVEDTRDGSGPLMGQAGTPGA
ncbi:hypothetical protein HGM15179_006187 [Zosterops borbonicus]|uniref:Phosphoinositide-3-kinase-interacting protein 1 n=1 Tax=Zosterops borbonicus TaxID=364589 RepID=A0A8K1GL60_9PASS|nr:hypothetical protein HGM15179_006187 [Zosterops borbonicus]